MDPAPIVVRALNKITAALSGLRFKYAAIGAAAHHAWGSKREVAGVDLLAAIGDKEREGFLGAARGEGLQPQEGAAGVIRFRYTDARLGGASAPVEILEASTPFLQRILTRAQPGNVCQVPMPLVTLEDLILLRTTSDVPDHRESVIELLRGHAARIDGAYLKKEAEAAGTFDKLKSIWQEAKKQG
ncbi:MAG TPA: hypothetical protein VF950_27990 [Planctomycetota bacterium]